MQFWGFAPDWTTANVRVFYKAFANKNKAQQVMYMHYQLRGLIMSAIVGDGVTYAMTGKHLWELGQGSDMSKVHLGGGATMTFSKQFMEPFHWFEKPLQSAINKMGIIPSTGMQIASGKQWVTPGGMSPPISDIGMPGFLARKALPIWMQQEGATRKLQSMAGFPVYGGKKESTPAGGLRSQGLSRGKGMTKKKNPLSR